MLSWRNFSYDEKKTDSESEYEIRNPTLGALSYLHVGVQLGKNGLEPGILPGHGWEERGSSQVIWSSKSEVG